MTNREKIAQIIAEHLCPQGKRHKTLYGAERACYSYNNFAECEKISKCVDALIEAGFGNVKELKIELCSKGDYIHEQNDIIGHYKACRIATDKIYDYCCEEAIAQAEREIEEEKSGGA